MKLSVYRINIIEYFLLIFSGFFLGIFIIFFKVMQFRGVDELILLSLLMGGFSCFLLILPKLEEVSKIETAERYKTKEEIE